MTEAQLTYCEEGGPSGRPRRALDRSSHSSPRIASGKEAAAAGPTAATGGEADGAANGSVLGGV
eukprot:15433405-Alexandrium_andersonii.AAC.1